jgi:cell division protein FtsZ
MARTGFVPSGVKIKVIGLGGGGSNAVTRMAREGLRGIELIVMNTDGQALTTAEASVRIQLGERSTRGLGAGGDHTIGRRAAEESRDLIREAVSGADMVFITAGMGGGTGTGSAPMVAEFAKQTGALTIAVVTRPFSFEGTHRARTARQGIEELTKNVDTLITIPNDQLLSLITHRTSVADAFRMADEVLHQGVQAIAEVITVPGLINLDFADVRTIMKNAGPAWMSIGRATGPDRALAAAQQALSSPLLDVSVRGATGVLLNITGGSSLSIFEVNRAAEAIRTAVDKKANVIFGVVLDPDMGETVRLTLIATGFLSVEEAAARVKEKELAHLLHGMTEDQMDNPSFLRSFAGHPTAS